MPFFLILLLLLRKLKLLNRPDLQNQQCPRLFISHRQSDKNIALRMAQIAANKGFAFWLDLLDPRLRLLSKIPAKSSPAVISLLTACIIEMALINCTHVITCMTPQTRGTLWMPYEYGRISEIPGYLYAATAWKHPNILDADIPEYMHLGLIHKSKRNIEDWLDQEKHRWNIPNAACTPPDHPITGDQDVPELPEND